MTRMRLRVSPASAHWSKGISICDLPLQGRLQHKAAPRSPKEVEFVGLGGELLLTISAE
jgi:hypothetical protein